MCSLGQIRLYFILRLKLPHLLLLVLKGSLQKKKHGPLKKTNIFHSLESIFKHFWQVKFFSFTLLKMQNLQNSSNFGE